MPEYIVAELAARGVVQHTASALDGLLESTDVLYVTRVQKERFASAEEYERLKHAFVVTPATLAAAKPAGHMIVMHPLPRVGEIAEAVDADPRAAYFRQMQYGLYMRMALLALVLGVTREQVEAEATAARPAPAAAGL
jgi:aspartate carbamoyltransferase catalytic subunit